MIKFTKLFSVYIFLALTTSSLQSQNTGYLILNDSIKPIFDTNYAKAKSLLLIYENEIDPSETMLLLDNVLLTGDIEFYKNRIIFLMTNYGWNYTYLDTLEYRLERSSLLREIKKNGLEKWTFDASQKHFPIWVKNHTKSVRYREKILSLRYTDQLIREFIPPREDSVRSDMMSDLIQEIDFCNLLEIAELSRLNNGMLPNNFDNGFGIYYKILSILWHNLKSEKNFDKSWELLLPFIEKAYFNKKIDFSIFVMYDKWCNIHNEYQYYGTLNDSIKIKDEETFVARQNKYFLNDIN